MNTFKSCVPCVCTSSGCKQVCEEHTKKGMDKARSVGKRFNPAKCQCKQRQVKFFGLILARDGVVPDPAKIEALKNLPEPKDEKLLQSFLGRVN